MQKQLFMKKIAKSNKTLIILFFLFATIFFGCKKFDDNPTLGFVNAKKKIVDTWNFTEFYVDGADSMNYFLNMYKSETYNVLFEEIPRWANDQYKQQFSFAFCSNNAKNYAGLGDKYPSLQADWALKADDKLELLFVSCSSLRETDYKTDSCSYSEKHYPFEFTEKLLSNSNHYYKESILNIDKLYKDDLWLSYTSANGKKYELKFKRL